MRMGVLYMPVSPIYFIRLCPCVYFYTLWLRNCNDLCSFMIYDLKCFQIYYRALWCSACLQDIHSKHGSIDILFNNAGIYALDNETEKVSRAFKVNLVSLTISVISG